MKEIILHKKAIFLILAFILIGLNAGAEEPTSRPPGITHILGDQSMTFSLGGFIPLFFIRLADGTVEATNMVFGAKGSLQYNTYLAHTWLLSFELAGALGFTPNFNIYWSLPLTAKISYIWYLAPLELYFTLGLGANFQSFLGFSRVDFITRPEMGIYFLLDTKLKLGLSFSYWFNPQFASAEQEATKPGQSRIGNFMDVSISLIYHL